MIRTTATLVTPPAAECIDLSDVKLWAKIDSNADDFLIQQLIVAARQSAEKYTRRAFINQTWRLSLDVPVCNGDIMPPGYYELPVTYFRGGLPREIDLPYKQLQSITSVTTYNVSNISAVFASSNYYADTANGRLVLNESASWPSGLRSRVSAEILYVAGYGATPRDVPQAIKTAMLTGLRSGIANT